MRRIARVTVLCALLATTLWPVGVRAVDSVKKVGDCLGGPSKYRLVTRQIDADTLKVRVEVWGGVGGQEWSMFVSDNTDKVIRNTKTSNAEGFVRWVRPTGDRAGLDLIEMSAVNRSSGETCGDSIAFAEN